MPQPQGTYLRVQANERARYEAGKQKQSVSKAHARERNAFYRALDAVDEQELERWRRSMAALASEISKGEPRGKDEQVRKHVSKVLGEVRKILETTRDHRQLEAQLQVPVKPVLRAPANLGLAGAELTLVIALLQVLEVLVRLHRRHSK